jgi:spoIIIJ-associated protein
VEWVEVAGKTVEEATELALDQLGVAVADAEVIVLAEPKTGLFGRMRVEARVKVRVRPVGPRPKRERSRDRNRGGKGGQGSGNRQGGGRTPSGGVPSGGPANGHGASSNGSGANGTGEGAGTGTSRSARRRRTRSQGGGEGVRENGGRGDGAREEVPVGAAGASGARSRPERSTQRSREPKETGDMAEGMTLEEQGEVGRAFLAGLLTEYGVQATVETRLIDEDTVEIAAKGDELGLLVGPRGSTLSALQDLTRAVVQRQCPSRTDRILVDVAGYREKRSAALQRFSAQIAAEVIASGQEKALEAMSPADRKAVHDAVNEMEGVVTRSEGEDPNRYIVIAPAS